MNAGRNPWTDGDLDRALEKERKAVERLAASRAGSWAGVRARALGEASGKAGAGRGFRAGAAGRWGWATAALAAGLVLGLLLPRPDVTVPAGTGGISWDESLFAGVSWLADTGSGQESLTAADTDLADMWLDAGELAEGKGS